MLCYNLLSVVCFVIVSHLIPDGCNFVAHPVWHLTLRQPCVCMVRSFLQWPGETILGGCYFLTLLARQCTAGI
jgi:hypothetical protein